MRSIGAGLAHTLASNYTVRLVNLGLTVAVARMVGPAGMGIVAAALLAVEIVDTLRDFGLRHALIYQPDPSPASTNAAYGVILTVASLQALGMLAVAGLASPPELQAMLLWLAPVFLLSALAAPHEALLERAGHFLRRSLAETAGVAVKAVITLGLLWSGWGIESVAPGIVAGIATRSLVLWRLSDWRPSRALPEGRHIAALLGYGRHIIAVNIMGLCRFKVDQFAVAALLGPVALGSYFLAARIPEMAIFGVNVAISTVAFPILARIVRQQGPLADAYLTAMRGSLALMAPIAVGLMVTSDQIVQALFGAAWRGSSGVLAILALAGIPLTLGWSAGDVFKAMGRPELLTRLTFVEVLVGAPIVAAVAVLTRDVLWVAGAVVCVETASCALRWATLSRHARISARRTLAAVVPTLASAGVMGCGVIALSQLTAPLHPGWQLALSVLGGMVLYAGLILMLDRASLAEVRGLLATRASAEHDLSLAKGTEV